MDVEGRVENISVSGLLVRLPVSAGQTFPGDREITVSLAMPALTHAVQARDRVAHVVPDRFMGVEFQELDPELAQQVEQHVAVQPVWEQTRLNKKSRWIQAPARHPPFP